MLEQSPDFNRVAFLIDNFNNKAKAADGSRITPTEAKDYMNGANTLLEQGRAEIDGQQSKKSDEFILNSEKSGLNIRIAQVANKPVLFVSSPKNTEVWIKHGINKIEKVDLKNDREEVLYENDLIRPGDKLYRFVKFDTNGKPVFERIRKRK